MPETNLLSSDSNPPYIVNDDAPFEGMPKFVAPTWILQMGLDHLDFIILGYLIYRTQINGSAIISYKALETVTGSGRTTIYRSLERLSTQQYIVKNALVGKRNILFRMGPRYYELCKNAKTINVSKWNIQTKEECFKSKQSMFQNESSDVSKGNITAPPHFIINKNKEREEIALYQLKYPKNSEFFNQLLSTPKWKKMAPVSLQKNYDILREMEEKEPFLVYAAIEYSLLHDYPGIHLKNKDVINRAEELRLEQAAGLTPKRPKSGMIPETDDFFHFLSSSPKQTQDQRKIKSLWGECRNLIPSSLEMKDAFYSEKVCFVREGDTLIIYVPEILYEYLKDRKLPPFSEIKHSIKPIK